jgi:hypothetical protein
MITIKDIEKAKQVTKSLFDYMKSNKPKSLNDFRTHLAKDFGFNSLSDAFKKDNEEKLKFIQDRLITYIDDPRITLEVAMNVIANEDEDSNFSKKYFNKNLKYNRENFDYS